MAAGRICTDSTAAQRDQPRALLSDPAAVDVGVGLAVGRGQPGPAGQLRGGGEAADVTDLGHEHRPQGGTDAGDGLHRQVARIASEPAADQPSEQVDLEIQAIDQPTE